MIDGHIRPAQLFGHGPGDIECRCSGHRHRGGCRLDRRDLAPQLGWDFVAARTHRGTDDRVDVPCTGVVHRGHRSADDSCGHSRATRVDGGDDSGVGIGEHDRGAVGDHDRQPESRDGRQLGIGLHRSLPQLSFVADDVHIGAVDLGDEREPLAAQADDLSESGSVGCDEFVIVSDVAGEIERGEVPARVSAVPVGEGDVGGAPARDDEPRAQHIT
jgi:hypothetical protein